MEATIRRATLDDLKAIQDLNHALFEHDGAYDQFLDHDWPYKQGEEYFKGAILHSTAACFVADAEGEIVGYLAGALWHASESWRPIPKSEVENMLVKEEFRGQGVGERLIQAFLQWSKEKGVARVHVSANTQNKQAIAFYKKMGFVPYSLELEADPNTLSI